MIRYFTVVKKRADKCSVKHVCFPNVLLIANAKRQGSVCSPPISYPAGPQGDLLSQPRWVLQSLPWWLGAKWTNGSSSLLFWWFCPFHTFYRWCPTDRIVHFGLGHTRDLFIYTGMKSRERYWVLSSRSSASPTQMLNKRRGKNHLFTQHLIKSNWKRTATTTINYADKKRFINLG